MKQLKISKNINEVIGLPVSGAIVESKKILGPPDESKGNKSLFGVFSHVKVSDEDLNESKKIFEYEVQLLWRSIRLDTHALVWYLTGDKKITKKAIESIDLVISNRVIGYIPNASLLELLWITKIKDERLRSKDPNHPKITGLVFEDVLACLKKVENIFFVNIELEDFELVTQNIKAGLELHDSIITAIAIKTGSKLITNDEIIRESGLVEVVW